MDRYRLNGGDNQSSLVHEIAMRLLTGEVGILPTETVYGLMCSRDKPDAIARIFKIKQRDSRKKLQVLIASVDNVNMLNISLTKTLQQFAKRFWPGPLTIVVENDNGEDVGIRIPDDRFLLSILTQMKTPLVATSANISGGDPSISLSNNFKDLAFLPDFIVIGGNGSGCSSTVIRLRNDSVTLLREGRISRQMLQNILDEIPEVILSQH